MADWPGLLLVTHRGYNQWLLPESYPGETHVLFDNGLALTEAAQSTRAGMIVHCPSIINRGANPTAEGLAAVTVPKVLCLMDGQKPFWQRAAEKAAGRYDLTISIDAGYPERLWSPHPPRPARPWAERDIPALFIGTIYRNRHEWADCPAITFKGGGTAPVGIGEYWDLMSRARVVVNDPRNGYGEHVKGRVFETAAVGACLLERHTDATECYFRRGVERAEFRGPEDLEDWIAALQGARGEEIAAAMRARYLDTFTHLHFWERVRSLLKL